MRDIITKISELPEKFTLISGSSTKLPIQIDKDNESDILVISSKINSPGKIITKYTILVNNVSVERNKEKIMPLARRVVNQIKEVEFNNNNKDYQIETAKSSQEIIDSLTDDWKEKQKDSSNSMINEDSGIIKKISKIFSEASALDASDIHIEVRSTGTEVRLRINGELQLLDRLLEADGNSIVSSMYNTLIEIGSGTSFTPNTPQDALIDHIFNGKQLRFRFASVPSEPDGFDAVLRLLKLPEDDTSFLTLLQMGYGIRQSEIISEATSQPNGVIIMAGTTGSGKSTTISNMLKKEIFEKEGRIKVITVEDPPEYFIKGATQIGVKRDDKGDGTESFQASIRGAMRSDPDIIMIGEIRDPQTAEMCTAAIQTGHLVFTTIHASSALGIINRLENMGISRETLSSPDFFAALMYQKLVKKICPHCSISLSDGKIPSKYSIERILLQKYEINIKDITMAKNIMKKNKNIKLIRAIQDMGIFSSKEVEKIIEYQKAKNKSVDYNGLIQRMSTVIDFEKSNVRFQNENGCEKCKFSGITGRTVVAEIIRPDLKMLDLIANNNDRELKTYWKRNLNGKTVYDSGMERVIAGELDPWEYEDKLNLFGIL
jgi:type II secretory ATPase GspE/PulE/Tfp pilus assembly ATPase PilB-like protein